VNAVQEVRADAFVDKYVTPYAAGWESERRMPRELFVQAAAHGLTGLICPLEAGGQGLGVVELAEVLRKVAAADMACAFSLVVHNNLAAAIGKSGNDYLKESILPGMLTGEKIGAFLLTESQGGSDAAAIKTTAARDGDTYVVNGEKAWVSNGIYADVLSVYAQTDEGMLALLIATDTTGITRTDQYALLGGHALGTSGFIFDDVRVPSRNVLVEPGNGLKVALAGIDLARITVAAMCCGMLDASLKYAIDFARGRQFKGRPITQMQGIQWRLADVVTDLAAASALTSEAAKIFDGEVSPTLIAAEAKKFATTVAVRRIADCMQVMGAPGLSQEHPLARHFACAKMAEYLDGTTEIQNLVISRSLFGQSI